MDRRQEEDEQEDELTITSYEERYYHRREDGSFSEYDITDYEDNITFVEIIDLTRRDPVLEIRRVKKRRRSSPWLYANK